MRDGGKEVGGFKVELERGVVCREGWRFMRKGGGQRGRNSFLDGCCAFFVLSTRTCWKERRSNISNFPPDAA